MYANIYRELIPFVREAQEFHSYVYGSELFFRQITIRYLSTFWKPLNEAPSRLQRMLLKLTKYDLEVRFVPGKEQDISDCISREPLSETEPLNNPKM